jgi:hypothetical protein
MIIASCGTPEIHNSVNYSSYNSTLEGATVSFWCTNVSFQAEEFISVCMKNASWTPDPIRKCSGSNFNLTPGIYNEMIMLESIKVMSMGNGNQTHLGSCAMFQKVRPCIQYILRIH